DQALTRPVAFRKHRPGLDPPIVASAIFLLPNRELTVDQLVSLDALLGIQVDDRGHQHPFLVGAARIDRERLADLDRAFALVDVPVQRAQWVVASDGLANGRGSDATQRPPRAQQPEVGVDSRRLVEARLERWAVQVEYRLRGVTDVLRHRVDALAQLLLGLLAVRVPRRRVGPAAGYHREAFEVDHAALTELDSL